MIKIGLAGAGHLGKIHLRLLKEISEYELVGFYDPSLEVAHKVKKEFGVEPFGTYEDMLLEVDAVDIVTPTVSHYDLAAIALRRFKHVFIEKPVTETVDEAKLLIRLAEEANVRVQVGHVERFNPAFRGAVDYISQPMFIESHRLAQFNPRGTDVSVVLDLMIHDIDVILSVVKSGIRKISASGVSVVSDTPDIANARIEFDNGCVANLTASRISMKNMRKARFFQRDAYISVDFLEKKTEIIKLHEVIGTPDPFAPIIELGNGRPSKQIEVIQPDVQPNNAIKEELQSFAVSILNNTEEAVTLVEATNALQVAHAIMEKLRTVGISSDL
ncbi:MAG: Gfo/Idh/MocA family protein [Flavobacteriales bacterium]